MNHDDLIDLVERFAMNNFDESALATFEEHLLICVECQQAVHQMDVLLATLRSQEPAQSRHRSANMFVVPPSIIRKLLPQYSLEAAAGKFGRQMAIEPEGWVEVQTDIPLTEDMFVLHVEGHSMEPRIFDGSLCAFTTKMGPICDGKVLLIEQYGESGGSRYAVKLCRISESADPKQTDDLNSIHPHVILESINPDYKPLKNTGNIRAVAEFLFVVDPANGRTS